MAKVKPTSSNLACIGALAGMLLLGLAATLVVMTPKTFAVEDQQARRLQLEAMPVVTTPEPSHLETLRNTVFEGGASTWGTILVETLIGICFAFLYKKNTVDQVINTVGSIEDQADKGRAFAAEGQDDFEVGICGCFEDMWVCVHGLFCPVVRMAHTNEVSGVCGFWETILAFLCCTAMSGPFGQCLLSVYFRKKLKAIMGIEDHLINDVCVACWCPNLSICQSGTAVDRALGYEVTGCCDLEWNAGDYE